MKFSLIQISLDLNLFLKNSQTIFTLTFQNTAGSWVNVNKYILLLLYAKTLILKKYPKEYYSGCGWHWMRRSQQNVFINYEINSWLEKWHWQARLKCQAFIEQIVYERFAWV